MVVSRLTREQMEFAREWVLGMDLEEENGDRNGKNGRDTIADHTFEEPQPPYSPSIPVPHDTLVPTESATTSTPPLDTSAFATGLIDAPHPDVVIIPFADLNTDVFQKHWRRRKAIIIRGVDDALAAKSGGEETVWSPQAFARVAGNDSATIVDCVTGASVVEEKLSTLR